MPIANYNSFGKTSLAIPVASGISIVELRHSPQISPSFKGEGTDIFETKSNISINEPIDYNYVEGTCKAT